MLVLNRCLLRESKKTCQRRDCGRCSTSRSFKWIFHITSGHLQYKPDEHYQDISSLSSKDSSRASELSALGDERHHKDEQYWEGTNVEPSPAPSVVPPGESDEKLSASQQQMLDKRQHQHKKDRYWEGYNDDPQMQHSSPDKSRCHQKQMSPKAPSR